MTVSYHINLSFIYGGKRAYYHFNNQCNQKRKTKKMQDTFLTGTSWKISILYYISLHWAASFRCVGWLDWGWGACPTFAQMLIRDLIPYLMIQVNVQARRWRCSYLSLALKPSPNRDVRSQKKERKNYCLCVCHTTISQLRYLSFRFSRYLCTDAFLLGGPSAAFIFIERK